MCQADTLHVYGAVGSGLCAKPLTGLWLLPSGLPKRVLLVRDHWESCLMMHCGNTLNVVVAIVMHVPDWLRGRGALHYSNIEKGATFEHFLGLSWLEFLTDLMT